MAAQCFVYGGEIPRRIAKFESVAMGSRKRSEKLIQPLGIHLPTRRQLKKNRSKSPAQFFYQRNEFLFGTFRVVEFPVVGDIPARFSRQTELRRRFATPGFQSGCGRKAVEAVVDFKRIELLGIPAKHLGR